MRLGLFGGTFDPPHIGHLILAQDAVEALALDRLAFVPAAVPPHKRDRDVSPGAVRLAMLRAAIAGDDRFDIDPLELERAGPSYTVDTLRACQERAPDARLVLLMGADQWAEIRTWKEPDQVLALAEIAVLPRGDAIAGPVLDLRRVDLSSTEIRERVRRGRPIRYLVPAAVEEVIRREGLYRGEGRPSGSPAGRTGDPPRG